jgi:hypothetical protein
MKKQLGLPKLNGGSRGCNARLDRARIGRLAYGRPGYQIFDSGSEDNSTGRCSRHRRRRGFMMKAILNGSVHHNMRDGCATRQDRDGVFPEEPILEIMDG